MRSSYDVYQVLKINDFIVPLNMKLCTCDCSYNSISIGLYDYFESFVVLNAGAVFVAKFFHPSTSSAMNSRTLLSSMLILMNALKQHKTYATRQRSTSTGMEKGLMRCLVRGSRDCVIAFGCILDEYLSDSEWPCWILFSRSHYAHELSC